MFDQITLENGLRVVGQRMPNARSVAVGLWIASGSQYEERQTAGVSHFIEHMLFKGTEKRSARQIASVMDEVGGQLNAYTAKDLTCFHALVVDKDLPLALDVLTDLVRHPRLDSDDIRREKGVVLEEIAMAEDDPEDVAAELILQAHYGDQPLARPILGSAKTVETFSREDILRHMDRYYRPERCVLSLAGNYDFAATEKLIRALLGDWKRGTAEMIPFRPEPAVRQVLRRDKDVEQLHMCVSYPGVPRGDAALYPMTILNAVFGGAMSSRLFQSIREEKGLAYSVFSYATHYLGTGMLTVYAGCSAENGERVLSLIREEAANLAKNGMRQEEFERTRSQMMGEYILDMESTGARMSALGRRTMLLGAPQTEQEVIDRIRAVRLEDVQALALRVLREEWSMALVGHKIEAMNV